MSDTIARDLKRGIGGSEAAAILGFNPYKTALQVWAEKTGKVEPEDLSGNEAVQNGKKLELPILEIYRERTGRNVEPLFDRLFVNKDRDFLVCHPDGAITGESQGDGVYEGKFSQTPDWEEGVPLMYKIQLQHNIHVVGASWGSVANLYGKRLLHWDFERDNDFISALVEALENFWTRHVIADVPPEPTAKDNKFISKLHPKDNGATVFLPEPYLEVDAEIVKLKERIRNDEARVEELEARIKSVIGAASYGSLGNGFRYSYKHQSKAAYTVKAWEGRVLRRGKEGR